MKEKLREKIIEFVDKKALEFIDKKGLDKEFWDFIFQEKNLKTNSVKTNTSASMGEKGSIKRLLNTVGKRTFIEEFKTWNDGNFIYRETHNHNVIESSAKAKFSCMKQIFEKKLEYDALKFIIDNTKKIDDKLMAKAKEIFLQK